MECPDCGAELNGRGKHYTCSGCGKKWLVTFTCEKCGELPKVAASCGSVSFFCDTCNELKSREAMNKTFAEDVD